ncbi:MAG: hypothetical protein QOI56_1860, partial [Actinomycetota bacterium]|nr:hypothetical protein [Actinomycetota bacterium]
LFGDGGWWARRTVVQREVVDDVDAPVVATRRRVTRRRTEY